MASRNHDSQSAAPPVLKATDVCVELDGHRVLDNVDIEIEHGEFVGIVGPNGGGKTTFLRACMGLVPTQCGRVELFGTRLSQFREHHRLAYVPQHAVHVDPRFPATVREVTLLGRAGRRGIFRRYSSEDRDIVQDALEHLDIADLADRPVGRLSGGQRQRVFIAQALAAEPDLLVLDEPTTGVDPRVREAFYRQLDHLNHDHDMTIVLVTHDTQAVTMVAHRLVAVNHTIVYDGAPKAFEEAGGFGAAYDIEMHHHAHEGKVLK